MPTRKLETQQDIEDFVRGGLVFGAGGSCLPKNAIDQISQVVQDGYEVGWVDLEDLPADAVAFSTARMGSPAVRDEAAYAEMSSLGLSEENECYDVRRQLNTAFETLRHVTGLDYTAVVSPEISDSTTAATLVTAAVNGLKVIDGSYTTRAVPAMTLTTFAFRNQRFWPIASCDGWGNVCVINQSFNGPTTELLGKLISQAGFGLVGMAGFSIARQNLDEVLIPGRLSECLAVGRAMREARESSGDSVANIVSAAGGLEICRGKISNIDDRNEDGYYWGTVTIDCADGEYSYWFKNENFIAWKDGRPHVTGPDIITAIDLETFEPVANQASYVGQNIALIAIPIQAGFRHEEVYAALGPRAFGFDFDYQPIGRLIKAGKAL